MTIRLHKKETFTNMGLVDTEKCAYPTCFDTYKDIGILISYLNSISNLYCIGRNVQHRYNNINRSMRTAFESVKYNKCGLKSKDKIWSVKTENEYHEEKEKVGD